MKKNWKTTVLGIVAGGAIAVSTGNCGPLLNMMGQDRQQIVGAIAGAAVAVLGAVAKDSEKSDKPKQQ